MLFKQADLKRIKTGEISLAFRKWKKPSVKKGSIIKTSVGQIGVLGVSKISQESITTEDAVNAGFEHLGELLNTLNSILEGNIHRIEIRYHSADPRIELREKTNLSDQDFEILRNKLQRLDKNSKEGMWTFHVLKVIRDNPKLKASDLALKIDKEKQWLKINIRKLKNLGLTISHDIGYTISPLGEILLNRLIKENTTNKE